MTELVEQPPNPTRDASESVSINGGGLPTGAAARARDKQQMTLSQTLQSLDQYDQKPECQSWTCRKRLTISIFFDGTGNNFKADLPTLEHSNVARMYRAHLGNSDLDGTYPLYIPGIGTLFPEIGDVGTGGPPGVDTHNGMGAMGQDRLDYAFSEIQRIVTESEPRAKLIDLISISVFGFSRGATLARAFLRDLVDQRKGFGEAKGSKLFWQRGKHPMEVRFVGIWDTVASVGLPAGTRSAFRYRSPLREKGNLMRLAFLPFSTSSRAVDLCIGPPGANPTEGVADGHSAYANGLAIPGNCIAGRCVHMVAAHEQRNSFPLDSTLSGSDAALNTVEIVYPGMHTDVGGGYRPGEGGKGLAARAGTDNRQEAAMKPSQITLCAMYDEAVAAGVPLRRQGNPYEWYQINQDDFSASPHLVELFNHYMQTAQTAGAPLGDAMLKHMRLYFAWRFQHIRSGGRARDKQQIAANEKVFAEDSEVLKTQLDALGTRRRQLQTERTAAWWKEGEPATARTSNASVQGNTDLELDRIERQIKEVQAKIDTLPSRGTLTANLEEYDAELLDDVRCIAEKIAETPSLRAELRPHYRNLLETYEAEFIDNNGLRDEKIIAYFDDYIHDSLADFGVDFTLPSDPRVIYIGGDVKMKYAALETPAGTSVAAAEDRGNRRSVV